MRTIVTLCCLLICTAFLCSSSSARLLMSDTFDGKLDKGLWKGQDASWKISKGVLEINRIAGDGNGAEDFGYGVMEFDDFGLQLDFNLDNDPFPSKMELLFRAKDLAFYQLIITPVDGAGRPNTARWYKREGDDRGTWNEYIDLRAEIPFPVQTKTWYSLALLAKGFDFQLYMKKQGELEFQKVSEWSDAKKLHQKGTLGFHTNQLQHYFIDNVFVYSSPGEVNLAVEPQGKLAVTWGRLKRQ